MKQDKLIKRLNDLAHHADHGGDVSFSLRELANELSKEDDEFYLLLLAILLYHDKCGGGLEVRK